jgi:hypothetical protein
MKRLIISTILILAALSGCEEAREEVQHNETIYLQCLDAKREAQPLYSIEAYNPEKMLANLTNILSPECDSREGICDDLNLSVDGVKNKLVIEWLVSHPEDRQTLRSEYTIPFKKIDSVSYVASSLEPEENVIFLYLDMDEQEFHDFGVYDTILWR